MIRAATVHDVPEIQAMIRELAAYEKAAEQARATQDQLRAALFGEHPAASVLVAEDDTSGDVVGFALWFPRFSTWTGTRGMHLEDLYVRPHTRGAGHGKALLAALAAICRDQGFERFERVIGVGGDTVECNGTGPLKVNGKALNEPYVY
ncbi:GNAT family N-acetyltransferase, partial [Streptomyces cellulosae]